MNKSVKNPLEQLTDENVNKYKQAGIIATKVLNSLYDLAIEGASILELCREGDTMITDSLQSVYKSINYKGIAYPTCISVNNIIGNFSPLTEKDDIIIKAGDVVKIELGVHIDGFPAIIGSTKLIYDKNELASVTEKKEDLMKAISHASRNVLKKMVSGKFNTDIAQILNNYAIDYECSLLYCVNDPEATGINSYQVSQYVIDGFNDDDDDDLVHCTIISRIHESYDFNMIELELEENEVYVIDICYSSGTGHISKSEHNTTFYKRIFENKSPLKFKSSRNFLNEFNDRFPIHIKNMNDDVLKGIGIGSKECVSKELVKDYPVFVENKNAFVARSKFTVIVKNKKPILITGKKLNY